MLNRMNTEPLTRRLQDHRGRRSALSVEMLLAGMILAAGRGRGSSSAAIAEALAGMTPTDAQRLGIRPAVTLAKPVTAGVVYRQQTRLIDTLTRGWQADGRRYDLDWFTIEILQASVPADTASVIEAVAVDDTPYPSLRKRHADRTPSADPDARRGYGHFAHGSNVFFGYRTTIAVAVRSASLVSCDSTPTLGPPIEPHIVGLDVRPADQDRAAAADRAAQTAKNLAAGISEVIVPKRTRGRDAAADRGSMSVPSWQLKAQCDPAVAFEHESRIERGLAAEYAMAGLCRLGAFTPHSCPKSGTAAHHLAALAAAVAYNLRLSDNRTEAVQPGRSPAAAPVAQLLHHRAPAHLRPSRTEAADRRLALQEDAA